jgi:hypothetical protein
MNSKLKEILITSWYEPRAFFSWLVLLCLTPLGIICVAKISETNGVLLVATLSVLGAGISLVGFILSWIPPVRRMLERVLRRRFFYLACLITLIAVFYSVENWRGKRAWEKHVRELEAKGEKLDLASLARSPVPDEKNFAMTPLFKDMMDFFPLRENTNGMERLRNISATITFQGDRRESLPSGSLFKHAMADLEACREFYRGNTNYPQPEKSGTAAEDILVALSKFEPELNELREASANRPYSRFPLTYELEPPSDILLPHLSFLKSVCLVVNLQTIAQLETRQLNNAFRDLKLGFRLSDSIREEPIFIAHLVRIAMLAGPLQGLREGIARQSWSDAQLAEMEQYLSSINLLGEYKHAMRGERIINISGLDYMRRTRIVYNEPQRGELGVTTPIGPVFPGGWFYQNMLAMSQMHQDYTLACVDETKRRVYPEFNRRLDKATMNLVSKKRLYPYRIFAAMMFPAFAKASEKPSHMQTFVDAARISCALERYRLAIGKLPEKLDLLVPQFISAIPTDVIDGHALRYRSTSDNSYLIYSIGLNGKDDGGVVAWKKGKTPEVDKEKGDWVWASEAK